MELMRIVVEDPARELPEGTVVSPERARELGLRGVATLPVDPEKRSWNGAGGYVKRSWGLGWDLRKVPDRFCPIALFVPAGKRLVCWKMKVACRRAEPPADGFVRFAPDAHQVGASTAGLAGSSRAFFARELGEPSGGPWVVGGEVEVNLQAGQLVAASGYGYGEGLAVLWIAASHT